MTSKLKKGEKVQSRQGTFSIYKYQRAATLTCFNTIFLWQQQQKVDQGSAMKNQPTSSHIPQQHCHVSDGSVCNTTQWSGTSGKSWLFMSNLVLFCPLQNRYLAPLSEVWWGGGGRWSAMMLSTPHSSVPTGQGKHRGTKWADTHNPLGASAHTRASTPQFYPLQNTTSLKLLKPNLLWLQMFPQTGSKFPF